MLELDRDSRLALLKFVCSFVWTDLQVHQDERDLVMLIAGRMGLGADELRQVKEWLRKPPPAEELDPASVPRAHRELFLQAAKAAVRVDGRVVPAERDQLAVFRDLLRD